MILALSTQNKQNLQSPHSSEGNLEKRRIRLKQVFAIWKSDKVINGSI